MTPETTTQMMTTPKMKIEAYAKVNLTLEVLGVRADGYHALRSLVVPVSLADILDVEVDAQGAISSNSPYPDDLCVKAARILSEATGCRLGARILVEKRIPAGGGLGGGSADAAAVLNALDKLWKLNLPREQLIDIAARIGSDVPALVMGGAVLMEGRGEIVTRVHNVPKLWLVLANPLVASSTKVVYDGLKKFSSPSPQNEKKCYNIRTALESGDLQTIEKAMVNDLAFPAASLYPQIADALDTLRYAGISKPMMSGSGSTVFGLVPSEARGREIAALLEVKGLKTWIVHTLSGDVMAA